MSKTTKLELAGLTARVVGEGATTIVLMHGFGAPGDDLVALAEVLGVSARFVFPAAPIALGGPYGDARAWWRLDMTRLEHMARTGQDRTQEVPEGLHEARAQLGQFLDELAVPPDKLVLGGFSQGSMLALDVALHRAAPPAGIVVMSGMMVAAPEWTPRLPSLAGTPILMTHGRADPLLAFATAEQLRDQLLAAGADVEWLPFNGGHAIPPPALAAVAHFLRLRAV